MVNRHYFGTDGIRGRANQMPMTVDVALNLGKALGAVLPRRGAALKVLIGKDTRRSGYMFESALAAGINASGGEVLFTGPLPTPAIAHLTTAMRCDIGIVISASHNPYYDNGIKIFAANGFKLPDDTERELERYLDDPSLCQVALTENIGRSKRIDDAPGRYNAFIKSNFERDLSLDGLKIVIDCANGAAYRIAPTVLEELGAEIVEIGTSPNGYNINDGVGALHPETCAKAVLAHGAHIGISLDGDADRLILVDETGRIVDGDDTMVMLAIDLHRRGLLKRDTLVTTVMSNLGLHQALHARGIQTVQTAVGDRYVVKGIRLVASKAVISSCSTMRRRAMVYWLRSAYYRSCSGRANPFRRSLRSCNTCLKSSSTLPCRRKFPFQNSKILRSSLPKSKESTARTGEFSFVIRELNRNAE